MERKKILHLITGLEIGGAEMMLLKTLPRMQAAFNNRVCCIMGHGPMSERLEKTGIPVYYLNLKNIFDLRVIIRFKKITKEFQPDILVTYLIHADIFGRILGKIFGVKKIICSVRAKLIQPKYLPFLFLDALTSPLVAHYHFNSQAVADMYYKFFFLPKRKITVIPNGLEIEKYDIHIDTQKKKEEFGIYQNKTVLGYTAKLRKQKGHKYLITAFAKVLRNNKDVVLILIGDGAERRNIEKQAQNLGISNDLILLGNRDDIPEILQIIDIFVFPTLFEGMSNALMEAMAAGKPIIATDIPENKELIEDGISGILVPTKNPEAMCVAINDLINKKEKNKILSITAKNKVTSLYDIMVISKKYIDFIGKF